MLFFVKAPQREVVQLLTAARALDASVGPMSPSGRSAAYVDARPEEGPDLGEATSFVRIDEDEFATHVTVRAGAGPAVTATDPNAGEAAATLCAVFDSWDDETQIEALLRDREQDVESTTTGLSQLLPLPALVEREPDHVVVLTRLAPTYARMAAGIAGPAWLLEATAGCTAVVPTSRQTGPGVTRGCGWTWT